MAGKSGGRLLKAMMERMNLRDESPRQRSSTICSERGILEVQEEESLLQTFDLSNYDYHKIITLDRDMLVEVNFASHAFLPKNKQLTFGCEDDRDTFVKELEQYLKTRRGTSYANQVESFLVQQFEKWTSGSDSNHDPIMSRQSRLPTVPKAKLVAFLTKARIDRAVNISDLPKVFNLPGWRKQYNRMMQLKTSDLLVTVFDNYSIWKGEGEPREMTREMVREFLQPPGSLGHQNESNVTEDDLTNMIQVQCAFTLSKHLQRKFVRAAYLPAVQCFV